jgi:hypothetical protein
MCKSELSGRGIEGAGSGPRLTLFGGVRSVRGNRKFHVPFFSNQRRPMASWIRSFLSCPTGSLRARRSTSAEALLSISMTDHITGDDGLSNANSNKIGGRLGRRLERV